MEFSMKDFWNGNRRALARAITIVEDERDGFEDIMKDIYHHTGRAQVIGITGAPGAGKSTLSDALIKKYRAQGKTVGIVAVDPTSPFSGGAILGDRIRMNDLTLDKGVYIRSMGTRGSLGGLSRKTADAVKLMDAFGLDVIFIETVGVGQSEVDIVKNADTTLVVLVPGLGDDIQAIKAGILEIGDVFVINKCDRDGADRLNVEIEMMLDLGEAQNWRPPIERTIANKDQGVDDVVAALGDHRKYLEESGVLDERRRDRARSEMLEMIHDRISRHIEETISKTGEFSDYVEQVFERKLIRTQSLIPLWAKYSNNFKGGVIMAFKVLTVDHVGVAVKDLAKIKQQMKDIFGLEPSLPDETVEEQHVTTSFFKPSAQTEACELEFLGSTTPDGPIARFIEKQTTARTVSSMLLFV